MKAINCITFFLLITLKAQAQKIPPKIRVFSFVMLVCFLLTYLAIICYVALESLGGMF